MISDPPLSAISFYSFPQPAIALLFIIYLLLFISYIITVLHARVSSSFTHTTLRLLVLVQEFASSVDQPSMISMNQLAKLEQTNSLYLTHNN